VNGPGVAAGAAGAPSSTSGAASGGLLLCPSSVLAPREAVLDAATSNGGTVDEAIAFLSAAGLADASAGGSRQLLAVCSTAGNGGEAALRLALLGLLSAPHAGAAQTRIVPQ
jgi:hypothetical protein